MDLRQSSPAKNGTAAPVRHHLEARAGVKTGPRLSMAPVFRGRPRLAACPDVSTPEEEGREDFKLAISSNLPGDLPSNDSGAEVMEYVLILGLIVVATIVTIAAFGTKVLAKWTSVNNSM